MRHATLFLLVLLLAHLPAAARAVGTPAPDSLDLIDWSQVPEYRIVPGDQLTFNFGPTVNPGLIASTDVLREVTVRPDGRITVFPVGEIVAAGRTAAEVQADVLRLLSAEMKQPRLTVEVSKLAGNEVHVLGQVKMPGSRPMGAFTTLLQAIAAAGGFQDDAARGSVMIMHRVGLTSVRVARVRVDRLLRNGGDVPLARNDIVYVPRSTIGNVDVFCRQFFLDTSNALGFALQGWELFNLDRVFQVVVRSPQ